MTSLRVSSEYMVSPVFCEDSNSMGPVELDELPISNELKKSIGDWDRRFQETFNSEYPPDSNYPQGSDKKTHDSEGRRLVQALQTELGTTYDITYKGLA